MSASLNEPAASGRYYDGKVAVGRHVVLTVGTDGLTIAAPDGQIVDIWPLRELGPVARDDTGMARIARADAVAAVLCDDASLVAALRRRGAGDIRRGRVSGWPKIAAWSCAAAAAAGLFFWLGLPLIARQAAQAMPVAWETALGVNTADQIIRLLARPNGDTCETPEGRAALDRMTAQLTAAATPRLPLHVRVVDSKLVNALTLPGGEVLVLRGLLDFAEHPNELAAVLAHEFAHSDLAHPTEIAIKSGLGALTVGLLLGDVFGGSAVVILAQSLMTAGYTHEVETQADDRMLATLRQAGLRSPPAAAFFERLVKKDGDVSGPFAILDTHPPSMARADRLRRAVPQGADALNQGEWQALKALCAMRRS